MNTNLNIYPYYDDFSSDNNLHQILFKPGYSVQARELTQIQSILKNQVAKFGNHIFSQGSVVIPGNSFSDLHVPYIKVNETASTGVVNVDNFKNKTIIGVTSGIRAFVKAVAAKVNDDPNTLYITYMSGGGESGINVFSPDEEIYVEGNTATRATLITTEPTGFGSLAFVNSGVFYVNGTFVNVLPQNAVISKYSSVPNCHVLLKIDEQIITSDDDESLLDPAQGTNNYAAPGADRVRITLTLTSKSIDFVIDNNYVELMRYRDGALEEHVLYPKYSELEKSLARRTYDESGDYLVTGLDYSIKEELKTKFNDGVSLTGSKDKFVLEISPGKAYVQGFEVEKVGDTRLVLDKARTAAHVKEKSVSVNATYGQYMYVTHIRSMPNFLERQVVDLYNDNDTANGSATNIGSLRVLSIQYHTGDPASDNCIYKLYYTNLVMVGSNKLFDAGGIRFASGSMTLLSKYYIPNATSDFATGNVISNSGSTRTATVLKYSRANSECYAYRHDHTKPVPVVGEIVNYSTAVGTISKQENSVINSGMPIFVLPVDSIKSIRNSVPAYNMNYNVWKRISFVTNGSGYGSYTISDGTFELPSVGVTVASGPAGTINVDLISLSSPTTIVLTGGPVSSTVYIYTQVQKTLQPKTKTLVEGSTLEIAAATTVSLGVADVSRINSIFSGAVEVTNDYVLDNGQTDYYYGISKLNLVGSLPSSPLTINFDYFTHGGSGDYFAVDSYTSMGSDYIAKIPAYKSKTNSQVFDLSNCLDFRPTMGSVDNFVGGSLSDSVVNNAPIITDVQYYISRIDTVYVDNSGNISVSTGIPGDTPVKPTISGDCFELYSVSIPAYTNGLADITVKRAKNRRFTMRDINRLQDRVANIEYYSTMSAIENSLLSYEVPDAITGLNRFKTGYLVDNFSNPFTVCDYYNPQSRNSFTTKSLSSAAEYHDSELTLFTSSTDYQKTSNQISLPYVEVPFIAQKTSSRTSNLNPFTIFTWSGVMTIVPTSDSWIETENLPTIYNTVDRVVTVTRTETTPSVAPVVGPTPTGPQTPVPTTSPKINVPVRVQGAGSKGVGTVTNNYDPTQGRITVWLRDLNDTAPADADKKITIQVPPASIDAMNAYLGNAVLDPILDPIGWTKAIFAQNLIASGSSLTDPATFTNTNAVWKVNASAVASRVLGASYNSVVAAAGVFGNGTMVA